MTRRAEITLDWADGTYVFHLAWGQLVELQEQCDAGPYVILQRLQAGAWRVQDISQVIRLGLIGGGTKPDKALQLIRDYVEARPPFETLAIAQAALGVALLGAPDGEPPGEAEGEATTDDSTTSPMGNSE